MKKAPYTPQQNEVDQRKNHTLIEMVRIMLDEYKTSDQFLGGGDQHGVSCN
jgi:hypothetical protein